jgi:DNA invertase Pin-like site-specific DNA recombinase
MNKSKYAKKITPHQRKKMRELFKNGYGIHFISRKFNCWPNTVWNHVYDLSTPRKISQKEKEHFTKNSKLKDDDILQIRRMAKQGQSSTDIAKIFGISQSAIIGIVNGKTYRWVESETQKGLLIPIQIERIRRKTDLRPGAKLGSKPSVKPGTLTKLAKKYKVAPSTIHRWLLKGKIHVD